MKDNYPSVQFTECVEIGCIISYSNGEQLIAKARESNLPNRSGYWKVNITYFHDCGDDVSYERLQMFPTEKEMREFIAYLSGSHEEYIKKYFRVD